MNKKELKIIFLNTWGGRAGKDKLLNFFLKNKNIDIFCLQEIWSAPYEELRDIKISDLSKNNQDIMTFGRQEISSLLKNHFNFFNPHHLDNYGLLLLAKKKLSIISSGEHFVFKHKGVNYSRGNHARNIQYIKLNYNKKDITIINFHGLWTGKGKDDTKDRIRQSENIIEFMKTLKGEIILGGDFNLNLDTKSVKMFEDFGLINLIRKNNIKSTRTSYYTKNCKFADYVFVSKGLKVNLFEIMKEEVSDHSAMKISLSI